jgi:hypothetical protein
VKLANRIVIIVALVYPSTLVAQWSWTATTGVAAPVLDLADGYGIGYTITVGVVKNKSSPTEIVGALVEVLHASMRASDFDGTLRVNAVTANLTFSSRTPMPAVHVIAGGGIYKIDVATGDRGNVHINTGLFPGVNLGARARIPGFRSVILELRGHAINMRECAFDAPGNCSGSTGGYLSFGVGVNF